MYHSGDSSEYYINGKHVALTKYTGELEKIGIVVKAKNCLVYQVISDLKNIGPSSTKIHTAFIINDIYS